MKKLKNLVEGVSTLQDTVMLSLVTPVTCIMSRKMAGSSLVRISTQSLAVQ